MNHQMFTGGIAQTNGYLILHPAGNLLIDAPAGIAAWLEKKHIPIAHLLLTHQHYDHVEDAATLQQKGAHLYAHSDYSTELTLESRAKSWGLNFSLQPYTIQTKLSAQSELAIHHDLSFQISHVPGHSPDSLTFFHPDSATLYSGDTLFAQSIGRTDLPGGNHESLLNHIQSKLFTLPPETRVYPGHGPATTIQREITQNPFF